MSVVTSVVTARLRSRSLRMKSLRPFGDRSPRRGVYFSFSLSIPTIVTTEKSVCKSLWSLDLKCSQRLTTEVTTDLRGGHRI